MARLWQLAFLKKGLIISSCALAVLSVAVSFLPFIFIYFVIKELIQNLAYDTGLNNGYLIRLGWLAGGSAVMAIVLNFSALMCSHVAAFKTLYLLKLEFTRHVAALPLGFHTRHSTGQLRKIVDENIEKLEGFIAHQLPDIAGALAAPLFMLAILFYFDWRLGLACLLPVIFLMVLQWSLLAGGKSKKFMQIYQDSLEDMNNASVEYVRGITVVKAFGQTVFSFRKFYGLIKKYGDYALAYTKSFKPGYVVFIVVLHNIYLFLIPAVIWIYPRENDQTAFALSGLFYLIFSMAMTAPILKMLYVAHKGREIADGIERMDKILLTPVLPEPPIGLQAEEYSITFDNVSFRYASNDDAEALSEVGFTAGQGQVTALVGPSGSGKSTIAHLIPRFYDVAEGAIKIGGVDIRSMHNDYLMSIVSFVFQDVFLFKQSVFDNIRIGLREAADEQVMAAAKAAGCHEFIEKLPQGYHTVIGSRNVHLSGGEKQRLVIARAILKNAPVIVLDEATAFADPENEHLILKAFEELMKDKTVLIIAHRLSTIRGADRIIVLDKGKIVEEGTHETLLKANGRYSQMWRQYVSAADWTLARPVKL